MPGRDCGMLLFFAWQLCTGSSLLWIDYFITLQATSWHTAACSCLPVCGARGSRWHGQRLHRLGRQPTVVVGHWQSHKMCYGADRPCPVHRGEWQALEATAPHYSCAERLTWIMMKISDDKRQGLEGLSRRLRLTWRRRLGRTCFKLMLTLISRCRLNGAFDKVKQHIGSASSVFTIYNT